MPMGNVPSPTLSTLFRCQLPPRSGLLPKHGCGGLQSPPQLSQSCPNRETLLKGTWSDKIKERKGREKRGEDERGSSERNGECEGGGQGRKRKKAAPATRPRSQAHKPSPAISPGEGERSRGGSGSAGVPTGRPQPAPPDGAQRPPAASTSWPSLLESSTSPCLLKVMWRAGEGPAGRALPSEGLSENRGTRGGKKCSRMITAVLPLCPVSSFTLHGDRTPPRSGQV